MGEFDIVGKSVYRNFIVRGLYYLKLVVQVRIILRQMSLLGVLRKMFLGFLCERVTVI